MKQKKYILIAMVILAGYAAKAQNSVLDVGLRLQRDIGLYTENGFAADYSNKKIFPDHLYVGFSYFTSRLGTAIRPNAIKQDNFLCSAAWYFRPDHIIRPFVRLNTGYFMADYPAIFEMLPHNSFLFSSDAGLCFQTHIPLKIATSVGYNFIYGQGNNNVPGTLYPLYFQITLSWNILKNNK